MPPTVDEQISKLNQTIAEMESQRPVLGGEVVDAALVPLYQKLADLLTQVDPSSDVQSDMPERQRKMVTLLFMDVVGSTKMTQHLDPEDTMDIMDSALDHLAVPVDSHGGKVTRFMGDGFMALFGDPVASEDDPEQAIRAGLKILEIAQALAHELEKEWGIEEFQIRVGVNTGLTVLGGLTEAENTVMGLPVNLAARLESAAPPGGLLISHDTYRHVRGVFEVEPQEPIAAKGFPEPVPVYLVKSSRPRAFRVLSRGVEGIETRMVGRDPELKILQDALYAMNEDNEGQVVTVLGEAGVGKSRLLYEFQNWMELLQGEISRYQGRAHHDTQSHPFSLLREVFTFRFQIRDNDPSKSVCQKIETGFCEALGTNKEGKMRAHFIGQLLGFDFSSSPYLKEVANDAQQLRNRGLRYLCDYFQTVSDVIPSIIFLEDIHWSDDSSLDAINKLGQLTPKHPLIIVCLARSTLLERRPYWGEGLEYHRLLELRPLTKRESRLLVSEILKLVDQVPPALRELVVSGAEGNPFYIATPSPIRAKQVAH